MKNFDKKGAAEAFQIFLVILMIGIAIVLIYVWLGEAIVEKQKSVIGGELGKIKISSGFAEWMYEKPEDFRNVPEKQESSIAMVLEIDRLETSFESWFIKKGFVVDDIECEFVKIMNCEFDLEIGEDPDFVIDYDKRIFFPVTAGMKEIRFTGELHYE